MIRLLAAIGVLIVPSLGCAQAPPGGPPGNRQPETKPPEVKPTPAEAKPDAPLEGDARRMVLEEWRGNFRLGWQIRVDIYPRGDIHATWISDKGPDRTISGLIETVRPDRITVNWGDESDLGGFHGQQLIYLVRWGDAKLLVTSDKMMDLCRYGHKAEPGKTLRPMFVAVQRMYLDPPMKDTPRVPREFQPILDGKSPKAKVLAVRSAEAVELNPPTFVRLSGEVDLEINPADGVLPGIVFYTPDYGTDLTVIASDGTKARATWTVDTMKVNPVGPPREGQDVSVERKNP